MVQQRLALLQLRDGGGARSQPGGSGGQGPDWRRELADAMAAERQAEAAAQQAVIGSGSGAPAAGGSFAEDVDEGGWLPK